MRITKFIVVGLFFFVTACGQTENHSAPEGISAVLNNDGVEIEGDKVQLDLDVLAAQGTPSEEDLSSVQSKPGSRRTRLARGSKLVALVDTTCSEAKSSGLSREIRDASDDKTRQLKHQAYSFALNSDVSLDDLSLDAEADECVLQIGNDIEMQAIGTPNDPSFNQQWQHKAIESALGWDVFFGAKGIKQDVIVAVVDTGVNYNHSDLKANMWLSSTGKYGKDFVNGDDDPIDDNGHGTHCAGLVGAVGNNATGGAGTMMANVKIMAIKGLNRSGSGSTSTLVNGINFAIANGAKVISLSLSGSGTSSVWKTALTNAVNKGAVVLAAAGNDGNQLSSSNFRSPAGYGKDLQGVMAVGSITSSLARSSFSNYSPTYVEISAPGSNILSTVSSGGYGSMSGTSMATPIAAGAAGLVIALLKSRGVDATPAIVEKLLTDGSLKDSKLTTYFKDGNRLNLRLLAQLIDSRYPGDGTIPTPPPPTPEPPAPEPPAGCGTMTGAACTVFNNINQERIKAGLAALKPLSNCINMSQSHATDMAVNNFFSHTSPTQGTFQTRARSFGVGGTYGENIAYGYTTTSVVTGWMNSSGHRANILHTAYRSTGVGYATNSSGRPYYVQCFSSAAGN